MLNRIACRFKHTTISTLIAGIIIVFIKDYRILGVYTIVTSVILYVFFSWLEERTNPKHTYEADEKGNAKPNYR